MDERRGKNRPGQGRKIEGGEPAPHAVQAQLTDRQKAIVDALKARHNLTTAAAIRLAISRMETYAGEGGSIR